MDTTEKGLSKKSEIPTSSVSVPTSSDNVKIENILQKLRMNMLKKIKTDLGQFGSILSSGLYEEARVWYIGGPPDRFWLSVSTHALADLNKIIQVTRN